MRGMDCPGCGAPVDPDAELCLACGEPLGLPGLPPLSRLPPPVPAPDPISLLAGPGDAADPEPAPAAELDAPSPGLTAAPVRVLAWRPLPLPGPAPRAAPALVGPAAVIGGLRRKREPEPFRCPGCGVPNDPDRLRCRACGTRFPPREDE
jgi:hypothetical protein